MKIFVNGKDEIIRNEETILSLLQAKGFNTARVVVELNDEMVKSKDWETVTFHEHDRLEIIKIVSGG